MYNLCVREMNVDFMTMIQQYVKGCWKRRHQIAGVGALIGMYHYETYMNKLEYKVAIESGCDWVMENLENRTSCYNIFRLNRNVFDKLHNMLVEPYGLKSTNRISLVEACDMFLLGVWCPSGYERS